MNTCDMDRQLDQTLARAAATLAFAQAIRRDLEVCFPMPAPGCPWRR
jgi:hypothetical protein